MLSEIEELNIFLYSEISPKDSLSTEIFPEVTEPIWLKIVLVDDI